MSSGSCPVCSKTVYQVEMIRALDQTFHKACFKCTTCSLSLNLKNVESQGGVLYCKVHLPKASHTAVVDVSMERAKAAPKKPVKTGIVVSSSESGGSAPVAARPKPASGPSAVSSRFGAPSNKCPICSKTVYPTEEIKALDQSYHKACFRCSACQASLNLKNFRSHSKILYCIPHTPVETATATTDDVSMQRALNAPKRDLVSGGSYGETTDASQVDPSMFKREDDGLNQTTDGAFGTGAGGDDDAPAPAPAPAPARMPAAAAAPAPARAAPAPVRAPEPEPEPEPVADEWAEEPAAAPAADEWAAEPEPEPAAAPAADEWAEEPAAAPAADEWAAEPAAASSGCLFQVKALYQHDAAEDGELSFPEGAIVNVLEELSADWWQGEYEGALGMFPVVYTERI